MQGGVGAGGEKPPATRLDDMLQATFNSLFYHRCHGLWRNSTVVAVLGLQPSRQLLLPFAGIAAATAKGNIFSGYDAGIVDDVLPACRRLSRDFH